MIKDMVWKRTLRAAALLIAALLVTALAACGKSKPNGDKDMNDDKNRTVYDPNAGIDLSSPLIDIVTNGTTAYRILLPASYSDAEYFSAQELSWLLEQCTGARPDIVSDAQSFSGRYISLGGTQALAALDLKFDYARLNFDGFFIKTHGGNVYINGANGRGVLYGVYEFAERFLGVRFLTGDHTYLPKKDSLSVHELDIVEAPEFRMRNYYNYAVANDYLFAVRSRMFSDYVSGGNQASKYGYESEWATSLPNHIHNSLYYVPVEQYKETHPEFYSDYTNPGTKYTELCYTNGITESGELDTSMEQSVAKAALATLKDMIRKEPNAKFFMFGKMDDGNAYCTCERCGKSDSENGGKTGTHVIFMNVMAREIAEWAETEYPGREINLVFFAYQYTEQPPVVEKDGGYAPVNGKVVLADNLYVRIAPIGADYGVSFADDRQMEFYRRIFNGWKAVTDRFMIWDYCTNYQEYYWYFPNLNYMKENINFYKELGTVYLMNQSSHNESANWQADMKQYIASKLYWHADRDVSELAGEFIRLHYGETAAPFVTAFVDFMEDYFASLVVDRMVVHVNALSVNSDYLSSEPYPIEFLEKAEAYLSDAIAVVKRDASLTEAERTTYEKRLTQVLLTPQRMILQNYESYYTDGRERFAKQFFENAEWVGVLRLGEQNMLSDAKAAMGL